MISSSVTILPVSLRGVNSLAQGCTAHKGDAAAVQPARALFIHLVLLPVWSGHGFGQVRLAPHTRHRSGSRGPAKCPQADRAAMRWEPCRGRDRRDARPWERAPGWDDRADPWAPLAPTPGQTGQLEVAFVWWGLSAGLGSCERPRGPVPSHMAALSPGLFVGQESARSWGRGHSPVERDCTQQDNDTLFPLLAPEVVAGGLIFFTAQDASPSPVLRSLPAPGSQRGSGFLKSELTGGGPRLQVPGPLGFPFPFSAFLPAVGGAVLSTPHSRLVRAHSRRWAVSALLN